MEATKANTLINLAEKAWQWRNGEETYGVLAMYEEAAEAAGHGASALAEAKDFESCLLGEFKYRLAGAAGGDRVRDVTVEIPLFRFRYDTETGQITPLGQLVAVSAYRHLDEVRKQLERLGALELRWKEHRDNSL